MSATTLYLDPRISMPISQAVHQVLEACGYQLVKQELLTLVYVKDNSMRLSFGFGMSVFAEKYTASYVDDLGPGWYVEFSFRARTKMKDMQVLDMLQAWEFIDYKQLPEFKKVVQQAYNEVRIAKPAQYAHS